jgi:phospholipid/cholesterol/gamma-HCH transport system permease protein
MRPELLWAYARREAEAALGTLALLGRGLWAASRRPWRVALAFEQAEFIGFGSLFIILLTGLFTGAVFTLQTVHALSRVGMESMVGSTVMLATTRELGPVLTALMVAGRVGSAMATELGTMRVSEQIDAMEVMAVDPYNYLVGPRLLACVTMVPCLCMLFDVIANIGAYVVAILLLGIDEGAYLARINWYLEPSDVIHGIGKAAIFGLTIGAIACYRGINAQGGARGVGTATTQTVVSASISVFVLDYIMTALLLRGQGL